MNVYEINIEDMVLHHLLHKLRTFLHQVNLDLRMKTLNQLIYVYDVDVQEI